MPKKVWRFEIRSRSLHEMASNKRPRLDGCGRFALFFRVVIFFADDDAPWSNDKVVRVTVGGQLFLRKSCFGERKSKKECAHIVLELTNVRIDEFFNRGRRRMVQQATALHGRTRADRSHACGCFAESTSS